MRLSEIQETNGQGGEQIRARVLFARLMPMVSVNGTLCMEAISESFFEHSASGRSSQAKW